MRPIFFRCSHSPFFKIHLRTRNNFDFQFVPDNETCLKNLRGTNAIESYEKSLSKCSPKVRKIYLCTIDRYSRKRSLRMLEASTFRVLGDHFRESLHFKRGKQFPMHHKDKLQPWTAAVVVFFCSRLHFLPPPFLFSSSLPPLWNNGMFTQSEWFTEKSELKYVSVKKNLVAGKTTVIKSYLVKWVRSVSAFRNCTWHWCYRNIDVTDARTFAI